jgi:ribonuclease HI
MDIFVDNQRLILLEVYFDGLCQPKNPGGIACYAYVIKSNGKTVHSEYGVAVEPFSEDATNNVAEYTALAKALQWLVASCLASARVMVNSDSQLVVNQLSGTFKIKGKRIIPLYKEVLMLKNKFPNIEIQWVPREQNREADRLTNIAYNKVLQENPEYLDRVAKKGKD